MQNDTDNFLSEEPMRILELFPVRKISTFQFDQKKFNTLYENLCCTICRDLFDNPVYLKCSHRFCKDCIEKYIRCNDKKSCPNCRGELTTKRDLRSDYKLISLMTYAFGDISEFKKAVEDEEASVIEKIETRKSMEQSKRQRPASLEQELQLSEISPMKRKKTHQQNEIPPQQLESSSFNNNQRTPPLKMTRTRSRKQEVHQLQENSESKKSGQDGELQNTGKEKKKLIQPQWVNTIAKSKGRKKKSIVIEIKSESEEQIITLQRKEEFTKKQEISQKKLSEIQEQPPSTVKQSLQQPSMNNLNPPDLENPTYNEANLQQKLQALSFQNENKKETIQKDANNAQIEECQDPEKQQIINNSNFQELKNSEVEDKQKNSENNQPVNNWKGLELDLEETNDRRFMQARETMKEYFGEEKYVRKLIEKTGIKCNFNFIIKKKPKHLLTPILNNDNTIISISLLAQVSDICKLLAGKLNIEVCKNAIKIYVKNESSQFEEIINKKLTMIDLIEKYWKSFKGVQPYELRDLIKSLNKKNNRELSEKVLYYKVDRQAFYS